MNPPFYEPDDQATYSLEIVSKITGISSQAILHYQETGLISSRDFTDDTIRTLRRIDHLQSECGVNEPALKLILHLINELEQLRQTG